MAAVASPSSSDEQTIQTQEDEPLLDVSVLKELARKALVDALNSHHGVDKMFWLEAGSLSASTTNVVYLCRPRISYVKIIADQIKRHARESQKHTYTLFLVPRTSTLITRILEEEGVLGDVTISSYNLQFIPIAEDVISLEHDSAFKEIWVDGDETVIYNSMQALISLQGLYGLFPRIVGKGDHAARLAHLLTKHLPTTSSDSGNNLLGTISEKLDCLIIIDRKADLITPMLTQLTYEGLVDELIGIKNSHVELPVSLLTPPSAPTQATPGASSSTAPPPAATLTKEKKKKHYLTSATDSLLAELRDLNFAAVGKKLNQVARRLDEDYKVIQSFSCPNEGLTPTQCFGGCFLMIVDTGLSEMLVPQTRTEIFNKSLEIQQSEFPVASRAICPELKPLAIDLLASYDTNGQISAIEELIAEGADLQVVLRLLCLASIITGGIKAKTLENIKREILQTYGYNYLPLLLSLASPPLSALLPSPLPASAPSSVAASKYPYTSVRKALRLLIEDPDPLEELENDISYVYSGYAPISVRLVQCVAQKGGVLSNPAGEKDKKIAGSNAAGKKNKGAAVPKVHAHPIVGWKGFEDVVASIPGEVVDIVQKAPGTHDNVASSISNSSKEIL
ncbi:hypothetical protein PHLCEN_2v2810 [Hermanssonia centrifuga]|uniref:Sec1-like protein n=1 Tax=Hermanssonia centrifuga TaxID=98765 RepID=A0A2R6RI14_9APHY|nr:hypothetical protein PHLCEN_2v2810 [Hermanssonia centrifuga]